MINFTSPQLGEGLERERMLKVRAVLSAALEAADPGHAVRAHVRRRGSLLEVGEAAYDLDQLRRVWVVGGGKAGAPMAASLEDVLGDRLTGGAVMVGYGHRAHTRTIHLTEAGHPLPDANGVAGTEYMLDLVRGLTAQDLVLCVVSGGASALMTRPVAGVSLQDLRALTSLLLGCGASINEINALRKHLDRVKGGGLARRLAPARVVSLILSDVVGSPLDVIASGPTVPDGTTFADACAVLDRHGLWGRLPAPVAEHLHRGLRGEVADTPKPGDDVFDRVQNHIVGSNAMAALAALDAARAQGLNPLLLSTFVEGEAREVGRFLAAVARELHHGGRPVPRPACVIAGGETTVTIRGSGKGGRNQELALAAALGIAGLPDITIACLATDGVDGPTDAAGALVDGTTTSRAKAIGLDPAAHLANNNAYPLFQALGDLLVTGPTDTNVNDLALLLAW
jgi:glycerate 2-kinase